MAEGKKSFLFYCDWQDIFSALNASETKILIDTILAYVNDQNPKEPTKGKLVIAWVTIKAQLKRDLKKWEHFVDKQKENGAKGGRPKTQKTQAFSEKPKKADTDTVTVTDTVNVTVTEDSLKEDAIEIYFNDLESSSAFEKICMDLKITPEVLKSYIPEFRKRTEMSYQSFQKFCTHLKRYVNIQLNKKPESTKTETFMSVNQSQDNQLEKYK